MNRRTSTKNIEIILAIRDLQKMISDTESQEVIKAVFETLSWSERTDSIVRIINNYSYYNGYETGKVKELFRLYNLDIKDFETDLDDIFLYDLYNELLDAVVQDIHDLFEYQAEEVKNNSKVKGKEYNIIINSLPLDKILMNEIINAKIRTKMK